MIAIDTNIMVYAHRPETPFHAQAVQVVTKLAEGRPAWGIPFHCLIEFAAVVTHNRLWRTPTSPNQATDQVDAWLQSPSVRLLGEDRDAWAVFARCLHQARTMGGALHDTRIAACCQYHGVHELWTADRDFSRYPWLVTRNPLVDSP
jgi:toxin-antitoxin system PIN domain toxin